jgi:hypothetical protein
MSLSFTLQRAEANFSKVFLSTGGELSDAVTSAETLVHVSGGLKAIATNVDLEGVEVTVPVERGLAKEAMLVLHNQSKGVSIAGTLGRAYQGEGAVPLEQLLKDSQEGRVTIVNAHYETSQAISATYVVSNVKFSGSLGEAAEDETEATQAVLVAWANEAYERRSTQLIFPVAPDLTKSVAHTAVGVGGSQYVLAHTLVDLPSTYSKATIEGLIKEALFIELGGDETKFEAILADAAQPGLAASAHAETLASAMSVIASLLVVYRSDSAAVMLPSQATSVSVESWLVPRGPLAANDCESSAFVALNMLHACMDETDADQYPTMVTASNVMGKFYSPAICVLAANGAEATTSTASSVAGHAIGMLVSNAHLIEALDDTATNHCLAEGVGYGDGTTLRVAREKAVFGEAGMPTEALKQPAFFNIEGTTPSSGRLVDPKAEGTMQNDELALGRLGSTIGRALRKLGGSSHRFYHSFLDITVAASHPLYADKQLRTAGVAATQYTLSAKTSSKLVGSAGITPQEAHFGTFLASPLHTVDVATGALLDRAEAVARTHLVPGHKTVLDAYEEDVLTKNINRLKELQACFDDRSDDTSGHGITLVLPYSALVSNNKAVEHMCETITKKGKAGVVNVTPISKLATTAGGEEAGYAISVSFNI